MKKFLAALSLVVAVPALALDSVSAETGHGTRDVGLWRLGAQWKQNPDFLKGTRWSLYWDAAIGGWHSDLGTVHDVGLTPVWRYAKAPRGTYFEGAIGFHILSDSHINSDLGFSTRFQFGDHFGAGYRFERYDLQLRLQHLSNGGMRNPNPGINFLILRVSRHLD